MLQCESTIALFQSNAECQSHTAIKYNTHAIHCKLCRNLVF
jgi:hypothetical protein